MEIFQTDQLCPINFPKFWWFGQIFPVFSSFLAIHANWSQNWYRILEIFVYEVKLFQFLVSKWQFCQLFWRSWTFSKKFAFLVKFFQFLVQLRCLQIGHTRRNSFFEKNVESVKNQIYFDKFWPIKRQFWPVYSWKKQPKLLHFWNLCLTWW